MKTSLRKGNDIVLVDDDAAFCALVCSFGKSMGLRVDWYTSLIEMGSLGCFTDYDAAILDYDLDTMTGVEIAEYFPPLMLDVPIVLVSGDHREEIGSGWPRSIKRFVRKQSGIQNILTTTVNVGRKNIISGIWESVGQRGAYGLETEVERLRKYPTQENRIYDELCNKLQVATFQNSLSDMYSSLRQMEELTIH